MMEQFLNKVDRITSMIGTDNLSYKAEEWKLIERDFTFIDQYSAQRDLLNTAVALRVVRALHSGMVRGTVVTENGTEVDRPFVCHCLSVCHMLINLNLPLQEEDEDVMLAAALCHELPVYFSTIKNDHALVNVYHIAPAVEELILRIYTDDAKNETEMENVFERISQDRIAALVKLADRGYAVEELFNRPVWRVQEYIQETRVYYMPLSIRAREYYPELDRGIGILLEKMRDIIEATEIFMDRVIKLEREMTTQITMVMDENARMRARIRKNSSK